MTGCASGRKPRSGLGLRVFGAMLLVVLAGAGTLLVVSLLVAPAVSHRHLNDAGVAADSALAAHADQGFRVALITAIAAGVLAAILVAAGVAALVARRIATPISVAAATAGRLAAGDYAARVATPLMGSELAELADSVNTLAQRLEATENARIRLLTDLAHELRTPLASIEATVAAITDNVLPADPHTLGTLTEQSRRLARLIDDLTAVSRLDEHAFRVSLQSVDLAESARAATSAVAARFASAGVEISVGGQGRIPARGDPDRIAEVLDQLLDNALRHCRTGDSVKVSAGVDDGAAVLTVSDTGKGFDPGDAELLFTRFHRAGAGGPAQGSGIGLTIARGLVEAQGGRLTAASPGPDRGATFTIVLRLG